MLVVKRYELFAIDLLAMLEQGREVLYLNDFIYALAILIVLSSCWVGGNTMGYRSGGFFDVSVNLSKTERIFDFS